MSIVTGDALQLIPTLDDNAINLVVTSPPYPGQYGNTMSVWQYTHWLKTWTQKLAPKLARNGIVALNVMYKRTAEGWFDFQVFELMSYLPYSWHLLDVYIYGKANKARTWLAEPYQTEMFAQEAHP